jgi:hypothetical protein
MCKADSCARPERLTGCGAGLFTNVRNIATCQSITKKGKFMKKITGISAGLWLLLLASLCASAQISPDEQAARDQISSLLSQGQISQAQQVFNSLSPFGTTGAAATGSAPTGSAATGPVAFASIASGSVAFEEIKACGFYPQETRLECAIEIKQKSGYGGPVGAFGSIEHVYYCVNYSGAAFAPSDFVGEGILQIHDEAGAATPPWEYAVYRDFPLLGGFRTTNAGANTTTATTGPTIRVRAILSWFNPVTSCTSTPIWGNVVDFNIRFDPIR